MILAMLQERQWQQAHANADDSAGMLVVEQSSLSCPIGLVRVVLKTFLS